MSKNIILKKKIGVTDPKFTFTSDYSGTLPHREGIIFFEVFTNFNQNLRKYKNFSKILSK